VQTSDFAFLELQVPVVLTAIDSQAMYRERQDLMYLLHCTWGMGFGNPNASFVEEVPSYSSNAKELAILPDRLHFTALQTTNWS
jgi:hypothetical protein